jgi:hypothetical protein
MASCFSNTEKKKVAKERNIDASQATSKLEINKDTMLENRVYKAILELPEIKSYSHKLDSLSKGKQRMTALIKSTPSKEEPYYWVQIGANNGDRLIVEYNFYIYPNENLEVKYYDTINEEIISLNEWRKRKTH